MDTTRAREILEAERTRILSVKAAADRLTNDAVQAAASEHSHSDQHPADSGSEVEEREKDFAVRAKLEEELTEVGAAMQRLDAGTYGVCQACDKPIPDARLEAKPAARFCIDDQARAERDSA